jgi:hypothetical protein
MPDPTPDWLAHAAAQLARLAGPHADKKRATVIALADARLAGKPEATIWNRAEHPTVCNRNVYYKWIDPNRHGYDPVFVEVLETVTKLAREWRDTRALRALQQAAEKMALASPLAADQLVSIATAGQVRRARPGPNGRPQVFTEPAATPEVLRAAVALLDRAGMQTAAKSVAVAAALDADQFAAMMAQAKHDAAAIDEEAAAAWGPDMEPEEGAPNAD